MPTLVTGGTGFIGTRLVRTLRKGGEAVHLLCRKTSDLTGVGEGVQLFYGDVTDRTSLSAPMSGCGQVYHLAGYARNWAPDAGIYHKVNVGGFVNVAEAALECGVRRVVFTSTCLTLGPSNGHVTDEQTPRPTPVFFTDYEKTKHLAEQEAERFVERGLSVVIVNPTRVYGPGKLTEGNSVARMIAMFLRGRFPFTPGKGTEVGNYAYVDDVVNGHVAAMAKGRTGERYILGGENISFDGFFRLLADLSGRKPPRFHLSPRLARGVARCEELRVRAFGGYPLITPGWVETFRRDWAFSSRKAASEFGYSPRGLREGLGITCEWLTGDRADDQ